MTVATAGLLALMLIAPSTTSASTPGWSFDKTASLNPAVVKVGANAAWQVEIDNNGTSNISALYLSTDLSKTDSSQFPTYIGNVTYKGFTGPGNPCNPAVTGPLYCSFGALPAGGSILIDFIAFKVGSPNLTCGTPGNTYACWGFNLEAFGNGNTPSDKGGNSHGDTLKKLLTVATTMSGNFGGGFAIDTSNVSNNGLSRSNPQSENVTPPTNLIQVTVEDGLTSSPVACTSGTCNDPHQFGDWMSLNVNRGADYSSTPFKYVILINGQSVPGGVSAADIDLVHVDNSGFATTISQRCSYETNGKPTNAECVTVTKVGSNFQIVAWLFSNGGSRLTY